MMAESPLTRIPKPIYREAKILQIKLKDEGINRSLWECAVLVQENKKNRGFFNW